MTIDNYILKDNLTLVRFEAQSFPDGVQESFGTLNTIIPDSRKRPMFGISHPGKGGKIVYKAAVQEAFDVEAVKLGGGRGGRRAPPVFQQLLGETDVALFGRVFIKRGMIDEYCLVVRPVVCGSGRRLFEGGVHRFGLRLIESEVFKSGVVAMH